MQKIILIIIAAIVNESVAAHDQSKLNNHGDLDAVHHNFNEKSLMPEMFRETSWCGVDDVRSLSADQVLPWNLFTNFKPR